MLPSGNLEQPGGRTEQGWIVWWQKITASELTIAYMAWKARMKGADQETLPGWARDDYLLVHSEMRW